MAYINGVEILFSAKVTVGGATGEGAAFAVDGETLIINGGNVSTDEETLNIT